MVLLREGRRFDGRKRLVQVDGGRVGGRRGDRAKLTGQRVGGVGGVGVAPVSCGGVRCGDTMAGVRRSEAGPVGIDRQGDGRLDASQIVQRDRAARGQTRSGRPPRLVGPGDRRAVDRTGPVGPRPVGRRRGFEAVPRGDGQVQPVRRPRGPAGAVVRSGSTVIGISGEAPGGFGVRLRTQRSPRAVRRRALLLGRSMPSNEASAEHVVPGDEVAAGPEHHKGNGHGQVRLCRGLSSRDPQPLGVPSSADRPEPAQASTIPQTALELSNANLFGTSYPNRHQTSSPIDKPRCLWGLSGKPGPIARSLQ